MGCLSSSPVPCQVRTAVSDYELAALYAQADVFVYTSHFEAFGLPPIEAMACGTAVITTDCGGNRDYIRNQENCIVISPGNVPALTSSIYQLLTNDRERERLAYAGLSTAKSWTWQRTAEQVERLLLSL